MASMSPADVSLMNGDTPSHVQGAHSDAIYLGTDLLKRNPGLMNRYFRRNNYGMTIFRKIDALVGGIAITGNDKPSSSHYERPRIKNTFTVGSVSAGTAPGTAVITLDSSDVVTTTSNGQTFTESRPRVKEVFQISQSGPQFWIIDKSADQTTITVKTFDGSAATDHLVADDIAVITHNYHGEGTGPIKPLRPRLAFYQNQFAISKGQVAVTGTALTTRLAITRTKSQDLMLMGVEDAEMLNERDKSHIWLVGQTSELNNLEEYSTVMEHNVSVNGTQGLIPYIEEFGFEEYWDPSAITTDDLYSLTNYYRGMNAGVDQVLLVQGGGINQAIEQQLRADGLINYDWVIGLSDKLFRDRIKWDKGDQGKGIFVDLSIQGFTVNHITFLQTQAAEFDDREGLGAIESYRNTQLVLPIGFANVYADNQGNKGTTKPFFGYEYRAADGYRRENEVWAIGGAGVGRVGDGELAARINKSQDWDGVKLFIQSEIAPHFALGQYFGIVKPVGVSS